MLLNVGLRTDIIQHYSAWLFNRFREGFVYSRNPLFPNRLTSYELTPQKVDAVLFCSKDYTPALARLREISDSYRTLFHYTLNGYGKDVEPMLSPFGDRLAALKELSRIVGREKIYWRYDPILLTQKYTADRHIETFRALAERIKPYVAGCIVNFVEIFIKLPSRMPELLPFAAGEKQAIAARLTQAAARISLPLRFCAVGGAGERRACVTLDDVGAANGCRFREIKHCGNRRGCLCIVSRDLGWYDCCPSGCRYCNANREPASVSYNRYLHDEHSPLLIGAPLSTDVILKSPQESYLTGDGRQMSLFD